MLDYPHLLNEAQLRAATLGDGSALIVAGAGTGKTRTIVYRLAWLVEHGVSPTSILLLTFTRKAAHEMLARAQKLLPQMISGVAGGTFHSFAYSVLRINHPLWLGDRPFTVTDSADALAALKQCKDRLQIGKGDRSFPKNQAVMSLFSKAKNKEITLESLIEREAPHLRVYAADLVQLLDGYRVYKQEKALLDYDDLLFELEALLMQDPELLASLRRHYPYILVDEYQDTNLVQARLVRLLAEKPENAPGAVMAVGDEAQSIYSFRGAVVQNILQFPAIFPKTSIVTLEQNYRSTPAILNLANAILAHAEQGYRKNLFTTEKDGLPVRLVRTASDLSQAQVVVRRIAELLKTYRPEDIAVLFRAGFHSFNLELALTQNGIPFRKFGGLKYTEASHVKDLIAYLRLVVNPLDNPSFVRVASMHSGIGPKTAEKLYQAAVTGDQKYLDKQKQKYGEFMEDLHFIESLRNSSATAQLPQLIGDVIEHYAPILEKLYPENYPKRRQALDEIQSMALNYTELDLFIADLTLESPEEDEEDTGKVILSTVHSAKGLEWKAVLIIDLVSGRFPSYHAEEGSEAMEEERRLMYVACTRARELLDLYVPGTLFDRRAFGTMPAELSPFLANLDGKLFAQYIENAECRLVQGNVLHSTGYAHFSAGNSGRAPRFFAQDDNQLLDVLPIASSRRGRRAVDPESQTEAEMPAAQKASPAEEAREDGVQEAWIPANLALDRIASGKIRTCRHRMFGRGRILGITDRDKIIVEFTGYGRKMIVASYLMVEK